jgi:hypothetical protein
MSVNLGQHARASGAYRGSNAVIRRKTYDGQFRNTVRIEYSRKRSELHIVIHSEGGVAVDQQMVSLTLCQRNVRKSCQQPHLPYNMNIISQFV